MSLPIVTQGIVANAGDDGWSHPFQGRNLQFVQTNMLGGNFFLGLIGNPHVIFSNHNIPRRARIVSATIEFTSVNTQIGACQATIFPINNRRYVLDDPNSVNAWQDELWGDFFVQLYDTGATLFVDTQPAARNSLWDLKRQDPPALKQRQQLGQRLTTATTFTLGEARFELRRVGTPAGNLYVEIYATQTGPTGAAFQIPGTLLARSDAVLAASASTTYADLAFSFSGANQISLQAGVEYVAVIRAEYPANPFNNFIELSHYNAFFNAGQALHFGDGVGHDWINSPLVADMFVHNFQSGDNLPAVAWNPVPAMATGAKYTTPDISAVVQKVVNAADYPDGGKIGVVLSFTGSAGNRRLATEPNTIYDSAVLDVTYLEPIIGVDNIDTEICVEPDEVELDDAPDPGTLTAAACVEPEEPADPEPPPPGIDIIEICIEPDED